ncbi:MAG: nitroreductase family protein [Elusimicrobium sp.]|jgi:nitroreductase|nr:nitroreductase family protein [Elusimicrobium sp.]
METAEIIFKRRSIRKYKPGAPVTDAQVKKLLSAAMAAPTARNMQEWEFLVLRDRKNLDKVLAAHPYAGMIKEAPCVIIVCGNTTKDPVGYWPGDCSAALQNILLMATDMGLGSVWLGVYPREERVSAIKKAFDLPAHIMPLGIAVIGTAAEEKTPEDRYDAAKVHFEKW